MRIPIRYQFMVPLVVVALASLAAISVVHAHLSTVRTRDRVERQLQGVAAVLTGSGFPLTEAVLQQMSDLASAEFVLTTETGNPVAASFSVPSESVDWPTTTPAAERAAELSLGSVIELDGSQYFHSSLELDDRRGGVSPQVLHILFPQDEFNTVWWAMFVPPLLIGLAAVVAVMLTTGLIAARINRVLQQLGREVRRLAEGDFSAVEVPNVNDETKDLAVAVNQTATRLAEYEAETRRTEQMRTLAILGSGLAHEMRNAATGCRMAVDLHCEVCSGTAAEDDSLEMARHQLSLMERRLQKFLRLGKQSVDGADADLDLAELVGEMVTLVRPSAKHAGVTLDWQVLGDYTMVHADGEQLSQAVMNLLLNAVDAAARQSAMGDGDAQVRVSLELDHEMLVLTVADSGEGPPDELAESLFEPFVSDKPEGVGLGLAVARQVAKNSGGSLEWSRSADETRFVLRLPSIARRVMNV
ncbi:HAMP domain-containing histidine kinase [Aeoliella sp. ICT_H6.2]|uniref:histidine kinase n=1 Tax=Aeoliella straminimaris TaxID=2954799 RepID=A0A9X2FB86_9BACT|nr:HAMP domain-containing sensor histidine kinase [Aeoliella straminimaris]MCO6045048.1 HAMP domain-containing histidine kinase [Aeoliella straminimaris]